METKSTYTNGRLVVGLLLIVAGALLLMDMTNLLSFNLRYYLISWKTLLIFLGILISANHNDRHTGFILIGLGVFFWLPELFHYRISLRMIFWPAILIGLGLVMITRRGKHFAKDILPKERVFRGTNFEHSNLEDFINEMTVLGGSKVKVTSSNFKGGKITTIFGGSEIGLMSAKPTTEGAVIDVFILFGGATLIVPDDWTVKSEVAAILGGVSDKRILSTANDPEKILILKGTVMFGGIEIKSY